MTINEIKNNIWNELGNDIIVSYNEGRNKVYNYRGKLIEVYSNVFIVRDDNYKRCFSYYDVLINSIVISFNTK